MILGCCLVKTFSPYNNNWSGHLWVGLVESPWKTAGLESNPHPSMNSFFRLESVFQLQSVLFDYILFILHMRIQFILLLSYYTFITSSTAQGGGGSFKNRKPIGELGSCESGMAERNHWWTERSLRSPLFLSLSLSFSDYLPTYLPIYLSMYLSIYLSLSLSLL